MLPNNFACRPFHFRNVLFDDVPHAHYSSVRHSFHIHTRNAHNWFLRWCDFISRAFYWKLHTIFIIQHSIAVHLTISTIQLDGCVCKFKFDLNSIHLCCLLQVIKWVRVYSFNKIYMHKIIQFRIFENCISCHLQCTWKRIRFKWWKW